MHRDQRIPWHKLLGQALADALSGLPYQVSTEEELALRSQRLDVLIIEQGQSSQATSRPAEDCPDGLEDLTKHNLLSFKAADEPFSAWSAEELLSHSVTYRKVASLRALRERQSDPDQPLEEPKEHYRLLPVKDFRCYAIATRFPRQLVKQLRPGSCQKTEKAGIYRLRFGTRDMRLVVINQLEPHPRNAPWGLFATDEAHWRAAYASYRSHSDIGIHLHSLIGYFRLGEGHMAYTQDDMHRDAREWLKSALSELDPEEVLQCYAPEDRLKGLDAEEVLNRYDPEDRLKGLDSATIEAWLAKQRRDH
ncbi:MULTISPECIES: hypothetical protein [Thiorhodovibrio]|uniref:hypothetical protein n=1 Tax=Thiorhodovibrio TaxID=61593 RepID=UPI0019126197|nr:MULTISPECIES: hypothetical protein [Thiorhodovibrio]MBK5969779.1 hypothetical protein [Thiorhodovibrio winogradskyi]WPL12178.1 hypothetical protein Thiosp_01938 [Thiorhodovibrio litoralis]